MSALDDILNGADDPACVLYHSDDLYFDLDTREKARAELAKLRSDLDYHKGLEEAALQTRGEIERTTEDLERCRAALQRCLTLAGADMGSKHALDAIAETAAVALEVTK